MADSILSVCRTADGLEYDYRELVWGDVIEGSKEVLQRMGIGVGIVFPGEPGGNKRKVSTTDPRGFPCVIEVGYGWSKFPFLVKIKHLDRHYQDPSDEWKETFPGVKYAAKWYSSCYKGSSSALTSAGIVPAGMFPGMPGMRSVRVTVLPDGTLPTGHRNSAGSTRREEGAMTIEKTGKNTYEVSVRIADELCQMRWEAGSAHRKAWEGRMDAMPRAARIDWAIRNEIDEQAKDKRAELRVIWSRPKFVPQFNILPA